jgi:hypothetical protein
MANPKRKVAMVCCTALSATPRSLAMAGKAGRYISRDKAAFPVITARIGIARKLRRGDADIVCTFMRY